MTGKLPGSGVTSVRKTVSGSAGIMVGNTDHMKYVNNSKSASGNVLNAKKASGSRFDILSGE